MYPEIREKKYYLHPIFTQWYPIFDVPSGTRYPTFHNPNTNTGLRKNDWDSFFFGGHVVRWTPYFRGTS